MLGEEAFFFSYSERRTSRQRHKANFEIDFFQTMTGNDCGFSCPQFLDAFLLIEEVNHLAAQAVVARMLYHLHALPGSRDVHFQNLTNLRFWPICEHQD